MVLHCLRGVSAMTEDPTNNGDFWKYQVDTAQRAGTTGQTLERRHGSVSSPKPTDGEKPHNQHNEGSSGFDADGIPEGI
jgi:hypothetical protein